MLSRFFLLLEYRIVWRRADLLLTILFWIQLFILKGFPFLTIVSIGWTPFAKTAISGIFVASLWLRIYVPILLMLLAYRIIFLKSWRLSKSDWMLLARTEAGLMAEPLRPPPSSIPISRTKSLMDYQRGDLHDYRQYIQYQSLSIRSDQNVPEAKKHEAFQSAESYVQILPGQSTRKVHKSLL